MELPQVAERARQLLGGRNWAAAGSVPRRKGVSAEMHGDLGRVGRGFERGVFSALRLALCA
eukprot:1049771-Prymnesium_polylepis.2